MEFNLKSYCQISFLVAFVYQLSPETKDFIWVEGEFKAPSIYYDMEPQKQRTYKSQSNKDFVKENQKMKAWKAQGTNFSNNK